jgi:uncharacterized damage-inducible protein DinB
VCGARVPGAAACHNGAVNVQSTLERPAALATRLREAGAALIAVIEPVDDDRWAQVPNTGVWSIGKDAEHVAEAAVYHQWIVRLTIGHRVSSRRPAIERKQLTTALSARDAIELIHVRTEEGVRLLLDLTDEQLDRPTRPRRSRAEALADTIERVLIGHYDAHRQDIETKLSRLNDASWSSP